MFLTNLENQTPFKPKTYIYFQFLVPTHFELEPGFELLMEACSQDWGLRCRLAQKLITVNLVQGFSLASVQNKWDDSVVSTT